MCGWCVLDSACTRQIFCGGDSTLGDWAQEPEQCILSISLQRSSMAVDFVQNVSITAVVKSPFNVKGSMISEVVVVCKLAMKELTGVLFTHSTVLSSIESLAVNRVYITL